MKICEKGEHCIDCPIIDDTAEPCESCIDVEQVVHCKDCKHSMLWRKPQDKVIGECYYKKMYSEDSQFPLVGENDFCSCGKQRD